MNDNDIVLMLGEIEASTKSAHKRIDGIEKLTQSIYELASSIKAMQSDLNDISERMLAVEEAPKKRWDLLVGAVISAIAGYIAKGLFM